MSQQTPSGVDYSRDGDVHLIILSIPRDASEKTLDDMYTFIESILTTESSSGEKLLIDCSGVETTSSLFPSLIVRVNVCRTRTSSRICYFGFKSHVLEIIKTTCLDKIVKVAETKDEAKQAIEN